MRWLWLTASLVLFGCAESHVAPDAGTIPDVGRVDAPACPDRDGDGFMSATCGGDDCDDAQSALSPTSSLCSAPTTEARCERGALVTVACSAATPVCDARVGRCTETACGDGVRQVGEECDDGNAVRNDRCTNCVVDPCTASSDCPLDRPWCSAMDADGVLRCQAGGSGATQPGENCTTNDECTTGWCDDLQGRCAQGCVSETDCGGAPSICYNATYPGRCFYQCFAAADCRPDRICLESILRDHGVAVVDSHCSTIQVPGGPPDNDRTCEIGFTCATGACAFGAGGCTVLCRGGSDCGDPSRPYCLELGYSRAPYNRPERFWGEHGRVLRFCVDGPLRVLDSCIDTDGDAEAAASCGGIDCNQGLADADVVIGCLSGTQVDACVAAVRTAVECPPATPLCRYPDGVCVAPADACGDRFVHAGEECDDGNHVSGDGCNECHLK